DLDALAVEKIAQHPAARERVFQMQFVDATHQREVLGRHRPRLVVDAAAADVQSLGLTDDGKVGVAADHLKAIAEQSSGFTLSMPALMTAPSKKSFSSPNSPTSPVCASKPPVGTSDLAPPKPKSPPAPSSSCAFQSVIWFG